LWPRTHCGAQSTQASMRAQGTGTEIEIIIPAARAQIGELSDLK